MKTQKQIIFSDNMKVKIERRTIISVISTEKIRPGTENKLPKQYCEQKVK